MFYSPVNPGNASSGTSENFLIGDFNGDGFPDRFSVVERSMQLGNGLDFEAPAYWKRPYGEENTARPSTEWNDFVVDANGDGLDDVVLQAKGSSGAVPFTRLMLSDGTKFIEPGDKLGQDFNDVWPYRNYFVTSGDFNGDGGADLLRAIMLDSFGNVIKHAAIFYSPTGKTNILKSFTNEHGGTVEIDYAPSSQFSDMKIPGVRQLVHKITMDPDYGPVSEYEFSYSGGRYDYLNRKHLGFKKIEITMPGVSSEADDLVQTTEYLTDNFASAGLVKRQYLKLGDVTYKDVRNSWDVNFSGKGPYRALKTKERVGTRHGSQILWTEKQFAYDLYNNPLWVKDLGYPGGQDDITTSYRYHPNASSYIVSKPSGKFVLKGTTPTNNPDSNRLFGEYFVYDGAPYASVAPTRGNVTAYRIWDGNVSANTSRLSTAYTHDEYGNVLTETDIRGSRTSYSYVGPQGIFRSSEENALGHVSVTEWHYRCQSPVRQIDPNGLVNSFTYDEFCREIKSTVGSANYQMSSKDTAYVNFGDPAMQYIAVSETSSNTTDGETETKSRMYFDGKGRVYKETTSGADSSLEKTSVVVRRFDARDRTIWESVPVSWATGADNDLPENLKVKTQFDPLNRPTRMTYPDGARSTTVYGNLERNYKGQVTVFPNNVSEGPTCHDGDTSTVCQKRSQSLDARGAVFVDAYQDLGGTDVGGSSGAWRKTLYTYDRLNRLTKVVDPAGLIWKYSYDVYGNLISQDDPGLGRWRMEYRDDDLLLRQIDARGQEIYFTYDPLKRETGKRVQKKDDTGTHVSYTWTRSQYDQQRAGYYNIGRLTRQSVTLPGPHEIQYNYNRRGELRHRITVVDGKAYHWKASYLRTGMLKQQTYHDTPGSTDYRWGPVQRYDTANRLVSIEDHISATTYDLRGNMLNRTYSNGARTQIRYNRQRGWVNEIRHYDTTGTQQGSALYTKDAAGRVTRTNYHGYHSDFRYTYDGAGRLLKALQREGNTSVAPEIDQTFTYDAAGRMRSNSRVGVYRYNSNVQVGSNGHSIHGHAPASVLDPVSQGVQVFSYDENGNMTVGLHGKVMTYDGENRPLSVTHQGKVTEYVYAADGTRLKKIERVGTSLATETAYINGTEIRNFGQGTSEELLTHISDDVRVVKKGNVSLRRDVLHANQLGSVIMITNAGGNTAERRDYRPFGQITRSTTLDMTLTAEDKGFIGERYDLDAGLQYLNARYYDPEFALFLQPDWFPVTEQGVGTNRYSYSFNDPVNLKDPSGNDISAEGSKEDKSRIEAGIEAIRNVDKETSRIVSDLEKSEHTISISIAPVSETIPDSMEGALSGVPTGSHIGWGADMGFAEVDEDGEPRSTPEADLAHELQHAHDMAFGQVDTSDMQDPVTPSHERRAVDLQNRVLQEQGKPTRDTYNDWNRTLGDRIRGLFSPSID